MKLRVIVVEADEVTGSDVAEFLRHAVPGGAHALPPAAPSPLQLPAAPSAASVSVAAVEENPETLPDQTVRQMAKLATGWRPKPRKPRPGPHAGRTIADRKAEERPTTQATLLCTGCGHSIPVRMGKRPACEKCGARSWEKVPAKAPAIADAADDDDDPDEDD